MSLARRRDVAGITDLVQGIEAQQVGSLGSDITGQTIDRQSYGAAQSGQVLCQVNSANSSDDIDFQVQESSDGNSWSDISGKNATGLDDANGTATIDLRNLQDQERYIRVIIDSANSNLASTNIEVSASVELGGKKTE